MIRKSMSRILLIFWLALELAFGDRLPDPRSVEKKTHSKLKFLFFGTSRTHGHGLIDGIDAAFPKLIHPDSVNLSIGGSNPSYPSICLYSMMKDAGIETDDFSFDVIVLEFDDVFQGVIGPLIDRLKQRYPYAKIIVIDLFLLVNFIHIASGKNLRTIYYESKIHDIYKDWGAFTPEKVSELADFIEPMTSDTEQLWKMDESAQFKADYVEQFLHSGAVILRPWYADNVLDAIRFFGEYFITDLNHFSEKGHMKIANSILDSLEEWGFRPHHEPSVREWDVQDHCESWYKTGETSVQYNPSQWTMEDFSSKHKFGLALTTNNFASLTMNNPLGITAKLALEYMVTSPDCYYPNVEITIENHNDKGLNQNYNAASAPIVIECEELTYYAFQVHISTIRWIGEVEPGDFSLIFHEREKNNSTQSYPFRVVGYVLARPEDKPSDRDKYFNIADDLERISD